ncbi:aldo/keto reductase [Candidatus Nanohalococcus occultus]|uniref:aldo/keto reductase n=1 Tax=Candidatus Nanohalococcus occultus TaxID=2978047 RepID=UPI0039DF2B2C
MEYVKVNDTEVPALGFGTWQLKGKDCVEGVKTALDLGYRHIDTAQAYENEDKVGEGIAQSDVNREDIFLTTKVWRDRLNEKDLKDSVEESLEKLQTDYVDLLLIHWPFEEMDLEAVLDEMNELVEEGKVKNIGVSNFTTDQIEEAQELSEAHLMTDQVEYHPFLDQSAVHSKCVENEMMLTAYSPLARGNVIGNETLKEIGDAHGKSEVQVALRWLIQQENVAAIPKATSEEHIEANLDVFDFELTDEEVEQINGLKGSDRKVDPDFAPNWD